VGLVTEGIDKFYGHYFYFTAIWMFLAIWYILWTFWCIFHRFGMLYQEKSGNRGPSIHNFISAGIESL
jgi:hypothetical protein